MSFTLLHTADFHLGRSFSQLPPERAGQRRADLLATLARICRTACELHVDLLCISGDLFDHSSPSAALLASARYALADAAVPVALVPGNHDPLGPNSPYLREQWPSNVMVAAHSGWQRMPVESREVWAFGYATGEAHHSPWATFPGCGDDAVLLLHAACLSPGLADGAGYYAFSPTAIPPCAYLALGHHHRQAQVGLAAWYCGAPEPLEPEVTPSSTLLVTLEKGTATVKPLPLATRHHSLATLDVTGLRAGDIWDRALGYATVDDLLTLRLTGMLDVAEAIDLTALRGELSARCFAVDVDASAVQLPVALTEAEGVMGALHAQARQRLADLPADDPQRTRIERAVRYAAMALEGTL